VKYKNSEQGREGVAKRAGWRAGWWEEGREEGREGWTEGGTGHFPTER